VGEVFQRRRGARHHRAKGPRETRHGSSVFFHLEELHSVTEGIAELVRDGGVFCVQAISLAGRIKYTQFDQVYHEHLTYWTVHSLDRLFSQYGLEIFYADILPIHGGSMELLVAPLGMQKIDASVEKMRREEKELGCDKIETYKNLPPVFGKLKRNSWPFSVITTQKEKRFMPSRRRRRPRSDPHGNQGVAHV